MCYIICFVITFTGPHSSYSTSYYTTSIYFALCGYAVLHINYRGSIGFGEEFLQSLPSRCGALDVIDCIDATDDCVKQNLIDENNLVLFGGSHGGFLALHLIGQYPDKFVSCVVRNPVCNVNAMSGVSDIPDWCWFEAGVTYNPYKPPSITEQQQMYAVSPIAHVHKVKTPVFMMLGSSDRRVPMSQALDYIRYIKGNNVINRVALYPDCQHSLADKVDVELDQIPNTLLWFAKRFYTLEDSENNKTMDLSIPQ